MDKTIESSGLEALEATMKAIELSLKLTTNRRGDHTPISNINDVNRDGLVHPNCEPFNCPICSQRFGIGEGIILEGCLHEFCRNCIVTKMQPNKKKEFIRVNCPFDSGYKCESYLSKREIRGLVIKDINILDKNNPVTAKETMDVDEIICIDDSDDESAVVVASEVDSNESFESYNSYHGIAVSQPQVVKFQCPSCSRQLSVENGIVLKTCNHHVCKECIVDYYFKNQNFRMRCVFSTQNGTDMCDKSISESEVRSVLDDVGMNNLDVTLMPNSNQPKVEPAKPLARNTILFCCGICCSDCPIGQGVKLTSCSHHVCETCLRDTIRTNIESEISCPYSKSYERCPSFLTHAEINFLTSVEEYKKFTDIAFKKATEPSELFLLTMMDELSYIPNVDAFDCPICFVPCDALQGIKLRDCLHEFCLECFINTVVHSDQEPIKCPYTDDNLSHCESFFQEREIRAVVPKHVYNKFLERKLKFAEHSIANTFHCKTVDCPGFGIVENGDVEMYCAICRQRNCLKCKAIHKDQTCEDYQDSLTGHFKVTERYINELKSLGDVMNCPKCEALINKTAGCSWIQCTFCKTEICWATKGPRWGPKGNGDTSAGCRCKINGKCHPQCENCH